MSQYRNQVKQQKMDAGGTHEHFRDHDSRASGRNPEARLLNSIGREEWGYLMVRVVLR